MYLSYACQYFFLPRSMSFSLLFDPSYYTIYKRKVNLGVDVLLHIAVIWERAQNTGSIATLNGNADSFRKERASPLVTHSFDQSARDLLKKETCTRAPLPKRFDPKRLKTVITN